MQQKIKTLLLLFKNAPLVHCPESLMCLEQGVEATTLPSQPVLRTTNSASSLSPMIRNVTLILCLNATFKYHQNGFKKWKKQRLS